MDLLVSLHLDGELPEQQTRISHLDEGLLAENRDLRLGFNACCVCAAPLATNPSVECPGCHRVKYCSAECREKDATLSTSVAAAITADDNNDETAAMGHSSIVCALLRLCNADDGAEEAAIAESNVNGSGDKNADFHSEAADQAARERIRSEKESYPATLANVLLEVDALTHSSGKSSAAKQELIIHVVGASTEAELWGRHDSHDDYDSVWDAYADALEEVAETNRLKVIRLCLIGPECPKRTMRAKRTMNLSPPTRQESSSSCQLIFSTHKQKYTSRLFAKDESYGDDNDYTYLVKPDVVCFFNPGFTCPDYSWDKTITCLEYGTAFIITANTEMEGIGDCQLLLERELLPSLPPAVAAIVDCSSDEVADEGSTNDNGEAVVMFGENPFAGSRVRQSGTMANDLYVKNRWLLAGVFGKPAVLSSSKDSIKKGRDDVEQFGDEIESRPKKMIKKDRNNKGSNPALI